MKRAKTVDDYINATKTWRREAARLRKILKTTPLHEQVKWGAPCYTHKGKNVVGIGAFKSYFGLWFFQGALLADENKVLVNAQEGKTKALRQWRMTSAGDIQPATIKRYVKEAIMLVDQGKEISPARTRELTVPTELSKAFQANKTAKDAFKRLRPGQQREYAEYVAAAKRENTRQRRIDKIIPMIIAGQGLNDRYR